MSLLRLRLWIFLAAVLWPTWIVAGNTTTSLETAKQLAAAGDTSRALAIIRPLVEEGNATAQLYLGIMLAAGQGLQVDPQAAAALWQAAADQNLKEAQFRLGVAFAQGFGVKRDAVEGMKWLLLAGGEGGMAVALLSEELSADELGIAQARANKWLDDNRTARLRQALELNSIIHGRMKVELLTALSDDGVPEAQYELGKLYAQGWAEARKPPKPPDVPAFLNFPEPQPNTPKAVYYYKLAAEQSFAPAVAALAAILDAGYRDPAP